jgi:glycosyltransferase involved in cell wall biosynthesis/ABC-type transporter Mla subunit MlaD
MNKESPLVSIIVRTKDRPKLLKRAIQSIFAQTYRPIEVIIVNDGGCDLDVEELKGILGDISLNYIKLEENTGRANAGNMGIESTKGSYIGFLDDDDEFYPKHVVTLVSFLEQSDYEIAYTDSLMVYKEYNPEIHELNNDVKREVVFSQDFNYDKLVFENYIPFMCLLFRRKPLITSGGFDSSFDLYEDWDLLIRIGKNYPFYHIRQVTANYNQWSMDFQISQVHNDPNFLRQVYLKVLSRHIDKITPNRIHDYISGYVYTRNVLKDLKNECGLYKDQVREKDSQLEKLNAELGEKGSHVEKLYHELRERNARLDTVSAELKEKTSHADNLTIELRERASHADNLTSELRERDARLDIVSAELKEKTSQVDILTSELRGRGSQLDYLIAELRERSSQIDSLYAELKEKGPRVEKLYNELRERDTQIGNLYAELKEKGPQLERLYNELKERALQIDTLTNELKEKTFQIGSLTAELKEKSIQVDTLVDRLKDKDTQIGALLPELKDKDTQIEFLTTEVRERASQLDTLATELKDKDTQIETLTTEVRERASQLDTLATELKDKDTQIETLTTELRGRDAQIVILQNTVRDREALITAMRNTRGWRILEKYREVRDRIFIPLLNIRNQDNLIKKKLNVLKNDSLGLLIRKTYKKFLFNKPNKKAADLYKPVDINKISLNVIANPIQSKISIIIPTKDAGEEFDYTLRRITQQEGIGEIELIIIDSGSQDRTVNISKSYTQNVFQIPPEEFHHGQTRNLGADKASGDFLLFMVQDAIPVGNQWLSKLFTPIQHDRVSAVTTRQLPRSDADLFASWGYWAHCRYLGYDHDQIHDGSVFKNFDELDVKAKRSGASLDSVCLGIKKTIFDRYRFKANYAEDLELGIRLIKDGHTLMFQSSNAVIHSHNRPATYFLKRSYVDTITLSEILQISRKNIPEEYILEAISHLYAVLKDCSFKIYKESELWKDSVRLIHSLIDSLAIRMNNFDPTWQSLEGDSLLDEYFENITPENHRDIVAEMHSILSGTLLNFLEFLKCYSLPDVREDVQKSFYKFFANMAGHYLGINTSDKMKSLYEGI